VKEKEGRERDRMRGERKREKGRKSSFYVFSVNELFFQTTMFYRPTNEQTD
jgi:hypothetical protein